MKEDTVTRWQDGPRKAAKRKRTTSGLSRRNGSVKRGTARAMRRAARVDPEGAPTKRKTCRWAGVWN